MNLPTIAGCLMVSSLFLACGDRFEKGAGISSYTSLNRLSETKSEEVDRLVSHYQDHYNYISMGLIGPEGTLLIRSYGADRIGKNDVYASVSKPVTSTIFFQMLEKGMIASVNDPIGLYDDKYRDVMPGIYHGNQLTFQQLLSHRSGIPHHSRIWKGGYLKLEFEPGSATMYSTRGFGVLGDVLCEIAGVNYNQLVQAYIGEPVDATSFRAPNLLFEAPGGLVHSTISDMVLFAVGIMENVYISDTMQSNVQWVPVAEDRYGEIGLGWYLTNYGTDSLAVYHAGSNGRPRAFIALRPRQHIGVVLMGKHHSRDGDQLFYQLARDLIQEIQMLQKPRSNDRG
jgi:CubicO group peptidase (beta-lactamase class C family)